MVTVKEKYYISASMFIIKCGTHTDLKKIRDDLDFNKYNSLLMKCGELECIQYQNRFMSILRHLIVNVHRKEVIA